MDIDNVRTLVTACGLVCFLAIVFWAYSRSAKKGFDEAAMLPFQDDEDAAAPSSSRSHTQG